MLGAVSCEIISQIIQVDTQVPCSTIVPTMSSDQKRRFPAPWKADRMPGGYKIVDSSGTTIAYIYGNDRTIVSEDGLTVDEARRIAANIAKLPSLLAGR